MKVDEGKPRKLQLYTENVRHLRKAGRRRNKLFQGRAYCLVIQYQLISPENIHASNITKTEQLLFQNIFIFHAIKINQRRDHRFEREQGGCIWEFAGRKKEEGNGVIIF